MFLVMWIWKYKRLILWKFNLITVGTTMKFLKANFVIIGTHTVSTSLGSYDRSRKLSNYKYLTKAY